MTGCRIGKITLKGGDKLIVLDRAKRPANPETVQYLEQALQSARAGELQSIAIAGTTGGGYVTTAFSLSQQDNPVLVLGAAQWLSERLMSEVYKSV